MITTKDQRKYFTHIKNYPQLIEFSKVFNAEISIVQTKDAEILELAQLAPALCDKNYKVDADYKVIDVKLKQKKRLRSQIIKHADKIRNYIIESFLSGQVVRLKDINNVFKRLNLTAACVCNHIKNVRTTLEHKGYKIECVKRGCYRIKPSLV